MPITDLIPWRKKEPVQQEEERAIERAGQSPLSFQQEMNRLFDDFFGRSALEPFGSFRGGWDAFSPRVDVAESDTDIVVSAELPGLDDEDIDVSLSRGMLTISGEKKQKEEKKGRGYYRVERSYGSFQRSIPVPSEVEDGKIEAVFKKGVLTITLPKASKAKDRKRIAIKTG
jgi:HSP20 family protein